MFEGVRVSHLRVLLVSGLIAVSSSLAVSANRAAQFSAESAQAIPAVGSASSAFTVIDAPGAGAGALEGTVVLKIDAAGDMAGFYVDATGTEQVFVFTARNGKFNLIDLPTADTEPNRGTVPIGFDTAGDLAGGYLDHDRVMHGFVWSAATGKTTTFDAPGASTYGGYKSTGTFPVCIDAGGNIAGTYVDSSNGKHGFVRTAGGVITGFTVPGSTGVAALSVNGAGVVVGAYADNNNVGHAFIRSATGTITTIDDPHAGTGADQGSAAIAVDESGDVLGMYADAKNVVHGYVRSGSTYTTIDAPGAGTGTYQGTYPMAFDSAGDVAGIYSDANNLAHGFVRTSKGAISTFDAPGALPMADLSRGSRARLSRPGNRTSMAGGIFGGLHRPGGFFNRTVRSLNKIGSALNATDLTSVPTGGIFNWSGGDLTGTIGLSFDGAGTIVGVYSGGDDVAHGFVRTVKGAVTVFDAPAAGAGAYQGTVAFSINAAGTIVGAYLDENSVIHAFKAAFGQATSTTTLSSSQASSTYGEPVTFTARVSSTAGAIPNGETVWFMHGTTTLRSETLSGGTASFTTTDLPGGTDSITAVYGGDTKFAGSTSASLNQTVSKATSVTTLVSSKTHSSYSQFVTLTATVTEHQYGGVPTGVVTFKSGTKTLGTASLASSSAGLTISTLPVGTSSIVAVYGGDANFSASSSSTLSQVVTKATPTIAWTTPAAIEYGTALSATQLDAIASVPGTFLYSPAAGTVPTLGSHTLSVTFTPADATDYASTGASTTLTVNAAAVNTPTVTITPSATRIGTFDDLLVKAIVNGVTGKPTPTGSVTLTSGTYTSGTLTLIGGAANFAIPAGSLAVGSDTLTVSYTPDSASASIYKAATGTSSPITVLQQISTLTTETTLALTSGGAAVTTAAPSSMITLTATVTFDSAKVKTGQVDFCDATAAFCTDIHLLGTAQLTSNGTASIKLRPGIGSHKYKAIFAGTNANKSSSSSVSSLTVAPASGAGYPTTTMITQAGSVGSYTLTAAVMSQGNVALSGTVSFLDTSYGNAVLGTAPLHAATAGPNWISLPASTTLNYNDALAVGDFNGDGIPDIVQIRSDWTMNVLLGKGDGTFGQLPSGPVSLGFYASAVTVGDFNGDGIADLAIADMNASSIAIFQGNGDGTFKKLSASPTTESNPNFIAVGDFNDDGIQDLASGNGDGTVTILQGNGDGTFKNTTPSMTVAGGSVLSIVVSDLNGDGKADLAVATYGNSVGILLGNGDGTFTPAASPTVSYGLNSLVAGDFNSDGKADLAVANSAGGTVLILLGNGDGTFTPVATPPAVSLPSSVTIADFNGDGIPDLAVINDYGNQATGITILLGNGDGTFTAAPSQSTVPNYTTFILAAELSGDGAPDLVALTDYGNSITALLMQEEIATAVVTGVSTAGLGPHKVVASYPGDSVYNSSTSAATALYAATPAPVFSLTSGAYTTIQTVRLTDSAAGATFYYTSNGSAPSVNSTQYVGPITVSTSETIQAIAVATGYAPSAVKSAAYVLNLPPAAKPVISLASGVYPSARTVTITDASPETVIHYSTNGTVPTSSSPVYTGAITVSTSETLAAAAMGGGYSESATASAQYIISSVPTSMIYTIAGNGNQGYSGDGGPATHANLNYIKGSALDSKGNLYIADSGNNRIRMVDAVTGIITTVAGTGTAGYSGDNKAAISAELDYPTAVAVDSSDNLYIADMDNGVIRKVSAPVQTGTITTFLGKGTGGNLSGPSGIAFDKQGNLYIAESWANIVQEFSAGTLMTIAGTGQNGFSGDYGPAPEAELSQPNGVAVDGDGDIYFADTGNNCVRKLVGSDPHNRTIVPVAGFLVFNYQGARPWSGYSGDGGSATQAELFNPEGLALDGAGNLYIADTYNSAIRFVSVSTGIINTIAGNGQCERYRGDGGPGRSSGLCIPAGVTADSAGNLYIADTEDYRLRKLTVSSLPPTAQTTAPKFSVSAGTYDKPQSVTISDTAPGASIYFTMDGTTPTSASPGYNGSIKVDGSVTIKAIAIAPGSLASTAVSEAYTITSLPALVVSTVAGNGGSGFIGTPGPATSTEIGYPEGVTLDASGNLYITDNLNSVVWKVLAKTGMATVVAGNGIGGYSGDKGKATSAELNQPFGSVVDSKGNLYIADSNNHVIRKVDGSTGIITTIAGNGKPGYGGDGGQASGALLDYPQGMALDSEGNLYFADSGNYLIRKINLSSGIISIAAGTYGNYGWSGDGGPATEAGVVYPTAVAFDGAGNFYIAEYDGRIRKVTKAGGIISTIAGNGDWGNDGDGGKATEAEVAPYGIAVDTAGDIYITSLPGAIRVISKSTGLISTVAGTGFYGYSGDGGSAAVAEFGDPSEIAFDAAGNLYIADYYNSRVRMVGPPPPTATPEFKPAAGTYSKTQSVTISDGTPGATIYYTTNGKAPTTSSTQYSGAITVSATETIKAMAAAPDHANSAIMTGNYTISTSSKASTAAASQLNAPGTGTR